METVVGILNRVIACLLPQSFLLTPDASSSQTVVSLMHDFKLVSSMFGY